MAGWDSHIQKLLATNCFTHVSICGTSGGVWATSDKFAVQPEEIASFERRLTGKAKSDEQYGKIVVAGKKYIFQRGGESIIGKDQKSGCMIARGNTCLIIGVYGDGQSAEKANNEVCKYAQYMKEQGY